MTDLSGRKKVMVAMSGGVDSSVSAVLLREAGFEVIGATLRLWVDPLAERDAADEAKGCCSYAAISDARKVCAKLDIPHYVIDMKQEFYDLVVCNFISEYTRGRTPSPCIDCNRTIKFSALLQKAQGLGINCLATGHYARIDFDIRKNLYRLLKGVDRKKDQSYMLYMLGQKELSSLLFPLGEMTKEQVRRIAAENKLEVADKGESQEICFIPDDDYRSFLIRSCPLSVQPGDIVTADGLVLGRHRGIAFYTIGQRKGLGLSSLHPLYVLQIDAEKGRVIVGPEDELFSRGLLAGQVSFVSGEAPSKELSVEVKIRYRSPAVPAVLYPPAGDSCRVIFENGQKAVSPGQSVVFYRDEEVIGGGVIEEKIADVPG